MTQPVVFEVGSKYGPRIFLLILFFPVLSSADKSSVMVEAREKVEKGSEIVIRINVNHRGNNFLHYTDRVYSDVPCPGH